MPEWRLRSGGPGSQPMAFTMLGSITLDGCVHLSFIAEPWGSSTIGIGWAVSHGSEWSLEMQMSTGSWSQTTAHWSFMIRVRPGDPS